MTGDPYIRALTDQRARYRAKAEKYKTAPTVETMDTFTALHMMYSGLETGLAIALSLYTPNAESNNDTVPS